VTRKARILLTDGTVHIFEHIELDDETRVIHIAKDELMINKIGFIPYESILMVTWGDEEIPEEVNEP